MSLALTTSPSVIVAGAGLVAGMMNALAGGGTFVTLPALIAVGVPSVLANTSSTVALFPGQLASAWTYREGLGEIGAVSLRSLLLTTIVGGAIGAVLLLHTPVALFDGLLPWLMAIATLALAFGRQLGDLLRRRNRQLNSIVVLVAQFALGIYGGYFGGGVGIMMMAMWSLLSERTLKSFNAPRALLVGAANTSAVLIFIATGSIQWREAAIMLVAATVGGVCGALIGKRAPAGVIRVGALLVSFAITVSFFVRAYAK